MNYSAITAPAGSARAITPNNDTAVYATALYVGTGGDVRVLMEDQSDVTFKNVANGSVLPIRVAKVFATGTTASDILGLGG